MTLVAGSLPSIVFGENIGGPNLEGVQQSRQGHKPDRDIFSVFRPEARSLKGPPVRNGWADAEGLGIF